MATPTHLAYADPAKLAADADAVFADYKAKTLAARGTAELDSDASGRPLDASKHPLLKRTPQARTTKYAAPVVFADKAGGLLPADAQVLAIVKAADVTARGVTAAADATPGDLKALVPATEPVGVSKAAAADASAGKK